MSHSNWLFYPNLIICNKFPHVDSVSLEPHSKASEEMTSQGPTEYGKGCRVILSENFSKLKMFSTRKPVGNVLLI